MGKKIAEMTKAELIAHCREAKIKKDSKALQNYAKRLKNEHKVYIQTFSAYAVNQRRSRAAAIGECALQAMDEVRGLAKKKQLLDGSLDYMITEQKVQDPDGRKGFHCSVTYRVVSAEKAHTEEWIKEELEKTFEKMMMDTDEMFPTAAPEAAKTE